MACGSNGNGTIRAWIASALLGVAAPEIRADDPPPPVVVHDWLVIQAFDVRARRPFNPRAELNRYLLDRDARPPQVGETMIGELGLERAWRAITANAHGGVKEQLDDVAVGAAFATVDWPEEGVALAELDGAATVWVNGVPQVGDYYGDGMGGLPVAMKKGANAIFVTGIRSAFRLAFSKPERPLLLNPFDATVSDWIAGDWSGSFEGIPPDVCVGVLLINASERELRSVVVLHGSASDEGPFESLTMPIRGNLAPRAVLKLAVPLSPRTRHPGLKEPGRVSVPIRVRAQGLDGVAVDTRTTLSIEVKEKHALRREAYLSEVDGSVQEYAVLPPTDDAVRALVVTLHGAGVDCMGQAASYSQKPDFWIVAPTNRRRFGFDWQDWGRRDVYEVLERMCPDRRRVYLTGHSMGGHGTWHLAANDPGTFAAIAPSAGWSSFDSYGGRPDDGLAELWKAADGASNTLSLIKNLRQLPTYVLHGTADDNVPVSEAQLMVDALTKADATPRSHFQEGAGHWWDGAASTGVDCVDWPEIFELFRATSRPELVTKVSLTSNDPSATARCDWVEVLQLERYGEPFSVEATWDPAKQMATVTTHNVRRISFLEPDGKEGAHFTIDGKQMPIPASEYWRSRGSWHIPDQDDRPQSWAPSFKEASWDCAYSTSSGPFKRAFDNQFVLVYGTQGSKDETSELYERARYDAAHWWYRANGHVEVMSDVRWLQLHADTDDDSDGDEVMGRNVIVYGNRDTNAVFEPLVPFAAPFDAARGRLRLGKQTFEGDSLGAVVVLPGKNHCLVGLFADTGPRGSRLGYSLTPFISGVGYPDYALFSSEILTKGAGGVLAAGFFDADWNLQK